MCWIVYFDDMIVVERLLPATTCLLFWVLATLSSASAFWGMLCRVCCRFTVDWDMVAVTWNYKSNVRCFTGKWACCRFFLCFGFVEDVLRAVCGLWLLTTRMFTKHIRMWHHNMTQPTHTTIIICHDQVKNSVKVCGPNSRLQKSESCYGRWKQHQASRNEAVVPAPLSQLHLHLTHYLVGSWEPCTFFKTADTITVIWPRTCSDKFPFVAHQQV